MSQRKSPRLHGFDYTQKLIYFVTTNCYHHKNYFGKIIKDGLNNQMVLSEIGKIARFKIEELSSHHPGTEVITSVVMPNHVHLLLSMENELKGASLSTVVGSYKAGVSRLAGKIRPGIELWQTTFHDHIMRDEKDLSYHYDYIETNVFRWDKDEYYKAG